MKRFPDLMTWTFGGLSMQALEHGEPSRRQIGFSSLLRVLRWHRTVP